MIVRSAMFWLKYLVKQLIGFIGSLKKTLQLLMRKDHFRNEPSIVKLDNSKESKMVA